MPQTHPTDDANRPHPGNDQPPPKDPSGDEKVRRIRQHQKEHEHEEIHEKAAASAHVVYHAILIEADEELERPATALAWSGVAAGLSMGFSLVTEGLFQSRLPDKPWAEAITKVGYTFGFLIVILGRQQLFTENTLTPVLMFLKRRDWTTFLKVARLWAIILVANLVGAALIAYTLQRTSAFSDREREAFLKISMQSMEPSVATLLIKSVFAGWLIALMVWMLPAAETGRIWVLMFIPYIVGLGALSHIIIGTVYAIYTVAAHQHTWLQYFTHFCLPVLLGNCVGGVTLVAIVNHGQVMGGKAGEGS